MANDEKPIHLKVESTTHPIPSRGNTARWPNEVVHYRTLGLSSGITSALQEFDTNSDGCINSSELMAAAHLYHEAQQAGKKQRKIIFALALVLLLMLGAIFGMSFAVVELTKDTKASSDGILRTTDGNHVVKVASVDSYVANGVMVDRLTSKPIATVSNLHSAALSSYLPNTVFKELKYFEALSTTGAYVYVEVNGFVRLPGITNGVIDPTKAPIIKMLTPYGTVSLEGTQLSFADQVPEVFLLAGFREDAGRRKLLGVAILTGWFEQLDIFLAQGGISNVTLPVPPVESMSTSRTYVPCGIDCEVSADENQTTTEVLTYGATTRDGLQFKYYDEVGYTYTDSSGTRMYKSVQTYERYPDLTRVEIYNGTHIFGYTEYLGYKYNCRAPYAVNKTSSDTEAITLNYLESVQYSIEVSPAGSEQSETAEIVTLETKAFSLSSVEFPDAVSTYYGHESNIDIPVAIVLKPKVPAGTAQGPGVITEFTSFDAEYDVDPAMFADLEGKFATCRLDEDYVAPPEPTVFSVGATIVASDESWGAVIPASEKIQAESDGLDIADDLGHYKFQNATRRRSLQTLYPEFPFQASADGCTWRVDMGGTYSAQFTHGGKTINNIYECGGPSLSLARTTTYPPFPAPGIVELQANVNINYDKPNRRWSASGCVAVGLACDSTLDRYGLGWAKNPICKFLIAEGEICANYDYRVSAKCNAGVEYYHVRRYGWPYCRRWSWGRCRSWGRHSWWERRSRTKWATGVASNYRIRVSGRITAGFDVWFASASVEARIDHWYIDANQPSSDGNYLAIYITVSGSVGWSRFSSGFQLLPWRGDDKCGKQLVWGGTPFRKLD